MEGKRAWKVVREAVVERGADAAKGIVLIVHIMVVIWVIMIDFLLGFVRSMFMRVVVECSAFIVWSVCPCMGHLLLEIKLCILLPSILSIVVVLVLSHFENFYSISFCFWFPNYNY